MMLALPVQARAQGAAPARIAPGPNSYVGNEPCSRCHASIAQTYAQTAMAHANGPASETPMLADFTHEKSGVHYRVYPEQTRLWLSFERPNDPAVRGKRELLYFIGSGHRGRTYLFSTDGFLFEAPVNWYGDKRVWDTAPAYQNAREVPLNLPVYTSCLHCHVSEMPTPLEGTENHYRSPLITHFGITCESCHGPGSAHVSGGAIVNPAKLAPERRDAVCMQCHMEGKAAIERAGKHVYDFRPGDDLSDYIRYYVVAGVSRSSLGAVSQVEAFAESGCKKATGNRMSCTSCHDPHFSPVENDRVSYYRRKCLSCHGATFAEKHHGANSDCTSCHMPRASSSDVAHTQVTDHHIPRWAHISPRLIEDADAEMKTTPEIRPFPLSAEANADIRGFALAWESLAENGMQGAHQQAELQLRKAVEKFRDDPALLSALGYVEQERGANEVARDLYQRAFAADPNSLDVATNLGVLEARSGHINRAVSLWQHAFTRAPARSALGMNLARVFCNAGKFVAARSYDLRVLEFNPDMAAAKDLLRYLNQDPPGCGPQNR